ncbi:MAG: hypothetical protein QM497_03140 [Sulfurimonas sp.]
MKKTINLILASEVLILVTNIYSFELFMNIQIGYLSSLFIILGSSYSYNKMIKTQVSSGAYKDERDLLDNIEDPHELFDNEPINDAPAEELDLKQIVKEEKTKVKILSVKNMKYGARGSMSAFRLVPYAFLILGFIALQNNNLLHLSYYLPALLVGIVIASLGAKSLVNR